MDLESRPVKPASASQVMLSMLMQPEHSNNLGNVHGGWIMKLVDEAGALACMRHAQQRVVTVAVDQMIFRQPIRLGDVVTITAEVSYVGNTSMEAEVHVVAENPITGDRTHTNTAYVVYVALDKSGERIKVPGLLLQSEDQRLRFEEGKARQLHRLEQTRKLEARQQS
jgi:uncharacterized protein (TIGR00369 family)